VLAPQEANYGHQQELDMIPLMMQKDYSPKGWLGLILGTRMWYSMWDVEKDDDAAFESKVDGIVREIGERGKLQMHEAVPPEPTPAPAPALAPAVAAAAASAAAAAPAPAPAPQSYTPSVQSTMIAGSGSPVAALDSASSSVAQHGAVVPSQAAAMGTIPGGAGVISLESMAALLEKQQDRMEERMEKHNEKMEAKLAAQREEARAELEMRLREAMPPPASEAISDEQLEALQERLQSLHAAKLLTESELCSLEDVVADCIEVCPTANVEEHSVDKTLRMLRLSEKMKVDSSLARQLRRKFVE